MQRSVVICFIVAIAAALCPAVQGSGGFVDITCPVCARPHVYFWHPWSARSLTCPWCLYSAHQDRFTDLQARDVDAVRRTIDDAERAVAIMCREAFGCSLDELVAMNPRLAPIRIMDLLALCCAEARTDLRADSVDMTRLLFSETMTDAVQAHLDRRLERALVRELDGPFEAMDSMNSRAEAAAWIDRLRLERYYELGSLRARLGDPTGARPMLERSLDLIDRWEADYGELRIRWGGQVTGLRDEVHGVIDRLDIERWSTQRIEEKLGAVDERALNTAMMIGSSELMELMRRDDEASKDAIARFAMRSRRHLITAAHLGAFDVGDVLDHPALLAYLRELAAEVPVIPGMPRDSDRREWEYIHRLTLPYVEQNMLDGARSHSEILRAIEERSLCEALDHPLFELVTVTADQWSWDDPAGFDREVLLELVPDLDDVEPGDQMRLPRIPDFYMQTEWPHAKMWWRMPVLVEAGSEPAIRTVIRWLPTVELSEGHPGLHDRIGPVLPALRASPELWPIVLETAEPPDLTPRQKSWWVSLRACAGDEAALLQLREIAGNPDRTERQVQIALIALRVCKDDAVVTDAIQAVIDEGSVDHEAGEFLEAVADVDDIDAIERAVNAVRSVPPLPGHLPERIWTTYREEWLWRLDLLEGAVRSARLRDLERRILARERLEHELAPGWED